MRPFFARAWALLVRTFDRPFFRLSALAFVLGVVASGFALRRAAAEVGQVALDMGEKLYGITDTLVSTTNLSFNGQSADVSTVRSVKSLDQLFEQFAALCQRPDMRAVDLDGPTELEAKRSTDVMDVPVFSFRSNQSEGVMVCFGGNGSLRELAAKSDDVLTGNLAAFGQIRYLFARQKPGGVTGLLVQSRGPWNVLDMFPETGDVPGSDIIAGARPSGSTRALSVDASGYGMSTYRANSSVMAAVTSYEAALRAKGFEVGPLPEARRDQKVAMNQEIRIATNDGEAFVISAHRDGDESIVSAVRLGATADARAR